MLVGMGLVVTTVLSLGQAQAVVVLVLLAMAQTDETTLQMRLVALVGLVAVVKEATLT